LRRCGRDHYSIPAHLRRAIRTPRSSAKTAATRPRGPPHRYRDREARKSPTRTPDPAARIFGPPAPRSARRHHFLLGSFQAPSRLIPIPHPLPARSAGALPGPAARIPRIAWTWSHDPTPMVNKALLAPGDVLVPSLHSCRNVTRCIGDPLEVALGHIACRPIGSVVLEGLAGGDQREGVVNRSATGALAIRSLQIVLDRLPEPRHHVLADHHIGIATGKLAKLDPHPLIQPRELFGPAARRSARRHQFLLDSSWPPSPPPCPRALRARSPGAGRTDSEGRMDLSHYPAPWLTKPCTGQPTSENSAVGNTPISALTSPLPGSPISLPARPVGALLASAARAPRVAWT
jgi:hypothetical protein